MKLLTQPFIKFYLMIGAFLFASPVFADVGDVVKNYNESIIGAIGTSFLNNKLLQWNGGGLVTFLFGVCFVIAFAQAFQAVGNDMLMKLFDLSIYATIAMALLGQPQAYSMFAPLFRVTAAKYQYDGARSLDRDIYSWMAYNMDGMSAQFFGEDPSAKLYQATVRSGQFTEGLIDAKLNCVEGAEDFKKCMTAYINTGKYVKADSAKAQANKVAADKMSTYDKIGQFVNEMFLVIAKITNPFAWFFPLLLWIFDVIRAAVNVFLLIGFGIMTAFSLFMAKLFIPFLLLPSQRGAVIKGLKIPLGATMWGFLTSLIVFMSLTITESMTQVGQSIFIKEVVDSGSIRGQTMFGIMLSMFLTQLVIAAVQIAALFKVPKLAENILNLSMGAVVGLGGELVSAAGGIVRMISSLAMPAVGAMASVAGGAMKAGGGAVLGAASGAFSGIKGAIGQDRINSMRQKFSSMPGAKSFGMGGGAGPGPGGAAMGSQTRAQKDSVNDSYKDYQSAKGGAGKGTTGSGDDGDKKPSMLSRMGSGALAVGKEVGKKGFSLGKSLAGEGIGMALDAATSGGTNTGALQSRLGKGFTAAGKGMKKAGSTISSGIDVGAEALQNKTRAMTAGALKRFEASTGKDRVEAQSSLAENLVQREMAGSEAKSFEDIETRMAAGEVLTSQDTETLTSLQNTNLNSQQQKTMQEALNKQYDSAAADGNFEDMIRLSNNKHAKGSGIQTKNEMNLKNMGGYQAAATEVTNRAETLAKQSMGSSKFARTTDSQKELASMIQSGMVKNDILTKGYTVDDPNRPHHEMQSSIAQKTMQDATAQRTSDMNEIVNKAEDKRTSTDYQNLRNIADQSKFSVKDQAMREKVQQTLKTGGIDFDFQQEQDKVTEMDRGTESQAVKDGLDQFTSNQIKIGNARINKDHGGMFFGKKGETTLSKFSNEDMRMLQGQANSYDSYLIKHNEAKAQNPDFTGNEDKLQAVKDQRELLTKLIGDIEKAKKKG